MDKESDGEALATRIITVSRQSFKDAGYTPGDWTIAIIKELALLVHHQCKETADKTLELVLIAVRDQVTILDANRLYIEERERLNSLIAEELIAKALRTVPDP